MQSKMRPPDESDNAHHEKSQHAFASMQDAPTLEATKEDAPPLRHWLLHSARLDHRIIDKTIATLTEEDCFSVADLVLLRGLPRFKTLFTAVTKDETTTEDKRIERTH